MGSPTELLLPVPSGVAEVFWSLPPSTNAQLTTEVGKQQRELGWRMQASATLGKNGNYERVLLTNLRCGGLEAAGDFRFKKSPKTLLCQ